MEKILWDDTYSVGVSQMDEEHKNILLAINQLVEYPEISERSEAFSEILGQLTVFAYQHFEHEERLMEEHGYPDLPFQRKEHQEFRRKIAVFCLKVMDHQNRSNGAREELLKYLLRWWKEHILQGDLKYRPFFEQRGVR